MRIRTRLKKQKLLEMKIQIGEKLKFQYQNNPESEKNWKSNDAGGLRAEWMKLSLFTSSIFAFHNFIFHFFFLSRGFDYRKMRIQYILISIVMHKAMRVTSDKMKRSKYCHTTTNQWWWWWMRKCYEKTLAFLVEKEI